MSPGAKPQPAASFEALGQTTSSMTGGRIVRTEFVPVGIVNLLTQVRNSYDPDQLRELADNIVAIGLLELPGLLELSSDDAADYLRCLNKLWATTTSIHDLVITTRRTYLLPKYGSRRTLAHRLLWNEGCTPCRERYGAEVPGTCWSRHDTLDPRGMEARVERINRTIGTRQCRETDIFLRVLREQLAENTYVPPDRDREAAAWRSLYEIELAINPRYSKAQLARSVGRSAVIVSEALRFCELPEEVRLAVSQGHIRWGIALEIVKLAEAGFSDKDLVYWKERAIVQRLTVAKMKTHVRNAIETQQVIADDDQLFVYDVVAARRKDLGDSLKGAALRTLAQETRHFKRRLEAIQDGHLQDVFPSLKDPRVRAALDQAEQTHSRLAPFIAV